MQTIVEKVPFCTLFMVIMMAISMYPLHAKHNEDETTEQQDSVLTDIVIAERAYTLTEMEPAAPAVTQMEWEEILWSMDALSEKKEPSPEKENEITISVNAFDQEEEEEIVVVEETGEDKEKAIPVNTNAQKDKKSEVAITVSNSLKPVNEYIEPVNRVNVNKTLNQYVLDIIDTYAISERRYPYLLNNDYANYNGVTQTLIYQGKELLKAHPSGNKASHCVGITFEVLFRAMQQRNEALGISVDNFNDMSYDDLFDFVMNWFAASGSKRNSNIAIAVEKYGIGERLYDLDDAKAGDFIDLNRKNGTGHTVVFINWIREGNRIIGLRYWSSQPSTGGINYNEEYFGNVLIDQMYIVRILPVEEYK